MKSHLELFGGMDVFITLIFSDVFVYVQTHQFVYIKYMQFCEVTIMPQFS
jgi:hypothetical protein